MEFQDVLIFFALILITAYLAGYIFVLFYNKRTKLLIERFMEMTQTNKPIVLKNIKLRYWTTTHLKTNISPNNYCDLYLFENCISIVRREKFIYQIKFAPIVLSNNLDAIKGTFEFLDCYKPAGIHFYEKLKGKIDIKLLDSRYKFRRIDITLKGLSDEQISTLHSLREWS